VHETPLEAVAQLLILLAIVLVAAKVGGELVERLFRLPPVLGELLAGIAIGPFALGGITIGDFGPIFEIPHDIHVAETGMAIVEESLIPVDYSLFFLAQLAAVVLLFQAGLETNRQQFIRYVRPATAVAAGGVILPFVLGVAGTVIFGFASFASIDELIPALFVGAIMTATSVGITARVLSDIGELDTPEGVTVLAGAVVDDVLGILVLAIVIGIADTGSVSAGDILVVAAKAIGFWLGLTVIGSLLAGRISSGIFKFRTSGALIALALALAFLASGIAESHFGLAMIIGAYSLGLALSSTELKHRIEEPMRNIAHFVVPVFFVVIGMQVDFGAMFDSSDGSQLTVISFAIVLTVFAIISKIVGAGLPALGVGFNALGAWRVAIGMLPRGEVALIIAGIGLASGVIGQQIFGVGILMTVVTTVLAPILLVPAFRRKESGLREPPQAEVASSEDESG